MAGAQVGPFAGKFRVLLQDRHEIPRKGGASSDGLGSHDLIDRNLYKPQGHFVIGALVRHNVVQNLQRGLLAAQHPSLVIFFS